jgi:hypothetical protein
MTTERTYTVNVSYRDADGVEQEEAQTFTSRADAADYANDQQLWESTTRVESPDLKLARSGDFV